MTPAEAYAAKIKSLPPGCKGGYHCTCCHSGCDCGCCLDCAVYFGQCRDAGKLDTFREVHPDAPGFNRKPAGVTNG